MRSTRHRLLSLIVFLSTLTSACNRIEEVAQSPIFDGERIPMSVQVGLGEITSTDSAISSVRIIVFDDRNRLVYNDKSIPTPLADAYTVAAQSAHGFNTFYIFCNEPAELTQKLTTIADETQIEKLTFVAAGLVPPLPMYTKVKAFVSAKTNGTNPRIAIGNDTYDYLPAKVTRMMAKISFMAIKKIATPEEDFVVEELRIRVNRMPAYTPVGEGIAYTGTQWLSSITAIGEGTLNDNNDGYTFDPVTQIGTPTPGQDVITFPDLYIPEHLLDIEADRSKATYLTIDAACRMKNGSTQLLHSTYQVLIGQRPPETYNIKRNNHYRIYATITGIGAMGIYAEIRAMERYDMAINWKPIDGLVIVSDRVTDYDIPTSTSRNINIWNDYTVYSGILKTYHSATGYHDILFKYGSLIGVHNEWSATTELPFVAPTDENELQDIFWYPSSYGNPYGKISNWASVPSISSGAIPLDNSRIHEALGDPCKLVGLSADQISVEGIVDNQQWHMATPDDYAILQQATDGVADAQGYRAFHTLLVPNVKTRDANGLLAASHNGSGYYWTTMQAKAFGFTSNDPASPAVAAADPNRALAVRCVRNKIPNTELGVDTSPSIGYQGNTTTGSSFTIISNIPHWTATLINNPADPEFGSSSLAFEDFSFAPGVDTQVHKIEGSNIATRSVYLPRKESQTPRTFRIRVTGIGFNGQTETVHITATQSGYKLTAIPSFTPQIDDKINWIPGIGGTYQVKLTLYPLDVTIPAGYLTTIASYHGGVLDSTSSVATESGQHEYDGGELVIKANDTPTPIGIQFLVLFTNTPDPTTSGNNIGNHYAMQNKK